jgi:hypothetical protein
LQQNKTLFLDVILMLSGAKILRLCEISNLSWVKLTENAKKIRKSLAVCENMYNFAAVFQIYVN